MKTRYILTALGLLAFGACVACGAAEGEGSSPPGDPVATPGSQTTKTEETTTDEVKSEPNACIPVTLATACAHHCYGDWAANGCGGTLVCDSPALPKAGTAACCARIGGKMEGKTCEVL